jgi:DNA-binding NarL/FixJ family response regulator
MEAEINRYTIVVVTPDTNFREILKLLLAYSFEFEVTGLFKKVKELDPTKMTKPDIILAETAGAAEMTRIKKTFPDTPVVAIISDETDEKIVKLFTAGAAHYIFKGSEPAVYLNTLKDTLEEKVKISDSVIKRLLAVKHTDTETSADLSMLTSREKDILLLLSKGLSYKAIAVELKISVDTVKRHCYNIYQKSGVDNKIGAINKLLRQQ